MQEMLKIAGTLMLRKTAWYVDVPTKLQNGTSMQLHNFPSSRLHDIWLRDVSQLNKWVPGSHMWTYIISLY